MNHPLTSNETVSIGKGLLICKVFFSHLWSLIEPKLPPKDPRIMVYEMHEFFCTIVCRGDRASVEWIESVSRAKGLPKEKLQDVQLTRDDLFSGIVEFCKIYDKRYDADLHFLLRFLESMKEDPNSHLAEWKVFKEAIDGAFARRYSPTLTYTPDLNWKTEFSENELLSVEEGFDVCTAFFMNLWLMLDPTDSLDETGLYATYYVFCRIACGEGASGPAPEGHAEWNEIIFRVKKIPRDLQKDLKLTADEVFLFILEFCKLYNKKYELIGKQDQYEANLHLIISLLKSMQETPRDYKEEWLVFKRAVARASNINLTSFFKWNAVYYKDTYND